jgi:hypothetical protein
MGNEKKVDGAIEAWGWAQDSRGVSLDAVLPSGARALLSVSQSRKSRLDLETGALVIEEPGWTPPRLNVSVMGGTLYTDWRAHCDAVARLFEEFERRFPSDAHLMRTDGPDGIVFYWHGRPLHLHLLICDKCPPPGLGPSTGRAGILRLDARAYVAEHIEHPGALRWAATWRDHQGAAQTPLMIGIPEFLQTERTER